MADRTEQPQPAGGTLHAAISHAIVGLSPAAFSDRRHIARPLARRPDYAS
jgi:hypothetical protein